MDPRPAEGFYGAMSRELNRMRQGSPFAAALMLMALSFAYGVLHAAGPGHGKAVVSAWLLGNEQELHRGIQIAFMSSLVQAAVAIGLISVLSPTLGAASTVAKDAARWLEAVSFLAVAGMGAWLCWQALRTRFIAGHGTPTPTPHPGARPPSRPHTTITTITTKAARTATTITTTRTAIDHPHQAHHPHVKTTATAAMPTFPPPRR